MFARRQLPSTALTASLPKALHGRGGLVARWASGYLLGQLLGRFNALLLQSNGVAVDRGVSRPAMPLRDAVARGKTSRSAVGTDGLYALDSPLNCFARQQERRYKT